MLLAFGVVAAIVLVCPPAAALAVADPTISSYSVTPSSLQAAGFTQVAQSTTLSYSDTSIDAKNQLTRFPPGLLVNTNLPQCSESDLQANACPANTQVGTSSNTDSTPATVAGNVYNMAPQGTEAARFGNVPVSGTKTHIVFNLRSTDYGLDASLLEDLAPIPGTTRITNLTITFNAQSMGSVNFQRMPTSCDAATSSTEVSNYTNAEVSTSTSAFTPTGCGSVPFTPKLSVEIGSTGATAIQQYPPVAITITSPEGNADLRANAITLPVELNTNNTAYSLCSQAQADSNSCPAASQFGTATAKSRFLATALSGPVYLIQQTSSSLPGLLLDLQGQVRVKIQTSTVLINNKQIQSVATNSPQLPVTELSVALNGGKTTGVFQNRSDLCFEDNSVSKFKAIGSDVVFVGWNDALTATKVDAKVNGCGAGVTGSIAGAQGRNPTMTLKTTKHPDAPNMKQIEVLLPKSLAFSKSRLRKGAGGTIAATLGRGSFKVAGRTLTVSALPAAGTSRITLKLRKGLLKVKKSSRSLLNRGKTQKYKVKVTETPITGAKLSTTTTISVKGRRR